MQTKFLMAISLASACSLTVGQATADVTLLNDTFEIPSGTATAGDDAADTQDTAWYSVGSDPTLTVTGAAGSRVLSATGLTKEKPFVGSFASTTLATTGDSITLSLDLQFPSGRSGGNFRIGLFSDGGTPNTADNQGVNNNDAGYFLQLGTPEPSSNGVSSLQKSTANLFDSGALVGSNIATGIVKDNAFHTLTLTVERTGVSEVTLTGTLTGATSNTSFSRVDSSGLLTTFNEIGVRYASSDHPYNIDNVVVTTTIPEPGSFVLALSGVALCAFRSRR